MILFVNRNLREDVKCWQNWNYPSKLIIRNLLGKSIKTNEAIECAISYEVRLGLNAVEQSLITIMKSNVKCDETLGLFIMEHSFYNYGYKILTNRRDSYDLLRKYRIFCDSCDSILTGYTFQNTYSKFGIYRLGTCVVTQEEKELRYWKLTEFGWKCTISKPSEYRGYILIDDKL